MSTLRTAVHSSRTRNNTPGTINKTISIIESTDSVQFLLLMLYEHRHCRRSRHHPRNTCSRRIRWKCRRAPSPRSLPQTDISCPLHAHLCHRAPLTKVPECLPRYPVLVMMFLVCPAHGRTWGGWRGYLRTALTFTREYHLHNSHVQCGVVYVNIKYYSFHMNNRHLGKTHTQNPTLDFYSLKCSFISQINPFVTVTSTITKSLYSCSVQPKYQQNKINRRAYSCLACSYFIEYTIDHGHRLDIVLGENGTLLL